MTNQLLEVNKDTTIKYYVFTTSILEHFSKDEITGGLTVVQICNRLADTYLELNVDLSQVDFKYDENENVIRVGLKASKKVFVGLKR